tara:strand:- start:10314 stop:10940 length:627 start_codon:yes stop_codon:yes gene_type:complete
MDKRKRIYYTKAQITEGLVTSGKEWMYVDGTEYIGQYHRYTTDEVFSEATYIDGKSKILIPYIDTKTIGQQNELGIDTSKNFEYNSIKTLDVQISQIPNPNTERVTDRDIEVGYVVRYFAYKVNDGQLLELNKEDYDSVGSPNGLDAILWKKFNLRWKITGPDNDILDRFGNIKESGIIDTNRRTLNLKSEEYPTLMEYITDLTEYAV